MRFICKTLALLLFLCAPAWATNGYFAHGTSAAHKAMGGTSTALRYDSFVASSNPAGTAWLGDAFEVGVSGFSPVRHYSASARGDDAGNGIFSISEIEQHRSRNEFFLIPALSYNRAWGERGSWGITLYGNGGMNTEYQGNTATFGEGLIGFEAECAGGFGGGEALGPDNANFCGNGSDTFGVDLMILFIAPSVSYRLTDSTSVGISPILAVSRFAAQGLGAFAKFSNNPEQVSDTGYDHGHGYGGRIGIISEPMPGLVLGASYQSRVHMSQFEKYQGLFAEQGDFDIPSNWNLGFAIGSQHSHLFAVDYQRINYSTVASVGLPFDGNDFVNNCAIPRLMASFGFGSIENSDSCLGANTGPGFGWQDMTVWKLGYQYSYGRYRWRAGYSRNDQPIPSSQVLFNVLAPGVVEEHYTVGLSFEQSPNFFIETALMYAPPRPVSGPNPLSNIDANLLEIFAQGSGIGGILPGPLAPDTSNAFGIDENDQTLTLDMYQYEFTVSFNWRY